MKWGKPCYSLEGNNIVLIHGFTSCPEMYDELAAELASMGANVVIPRLPHHGLADRMTDELRHLSAAEMAATASEALEIAAGLGSTPRTVLLATRDNTAARFLEAFPTPAPAETRLTLDSASHSFARVEDQRWLIDTVRRAIGIA